jgi:hypothetical protein
MLTTGRTGRNKQREWAELGFLNEFFDMYWLDDDYQKDQREDGLKP